MKTAGIINLPFGVIQLFKIGQHTSFLVSDKIAYRPDKVLQALGLPSFQNEMANNRASNTSPISMSIRSEYNILDSLFISYFRKA